MHTIGVHVFILRSCLMESKSVGLSAKVDTNFSDKLRSLCILRSRTHAAEFYSSGLESATLHVEYFIKSKIGRSVKLATQSGDVSQRRFTSEWRKS
jgi:hypothetical protein